MLTSLRKVSLRLCLRQEPQPERRTGSWGQPGRMNPKRASPPYPHQTDRETYESSRRKDGTSSTSCETSKPSEAAAAGAGRSSGGASRLRRRRARPPKTGAKEGAPAAPPQGAPREAPKKKLWVWGGGPLAAPGPPRPPQHALARPP